MEPCAREFYAASAHLGAFDMQKFIATWEPVLTSGSGVIFMMAEGDSIEGVLGGIRHLDLYSSEAYATELFWFIRRESRGNGLKLYKAFEKWAASVKCDQIRMAFLHDSMPEKLRNLYNRLGFTPIESIYTKRLACSA